MSEMASAMWLQRYHEIQRREGLTIEAERRIAQEQGRVWREYLGACEREGITPVSSESPDLGHW